MAFQTAKTMGWSTWDRLKRGYEEATGSGIVGGLPWKEADEPNLGTTHPTSDVKEREAREVELGSSGWNDKNCKDERLMGGGLVEENPWRTNDEEDKKSKLSNLTEIKSEVKPELEIFKMKKNEDDVNKVVEGNSDPLGVGFNF
ncbi:uncharacterized protein MELLADRAFT_73411 [Melampsora larici-populina 98AG31]|uniref:Uncharacterized protein n=1 Tax=Melampsora larici-populina (strain 98AG31 / pathotype 3-4-7) TaxID=747676 RepID=F4S7I6_MELLP|nr:uncharacterized protein MELLADRAFT_73411 [Melampsora larici-populina 98AG31]EGF99419.1 hypothetical protein MELLADRAFT_73411 [Melampsora larici-populina 98AG31]